MTMKSFSISTVNAEASSACHDSNYGEAMKPLDVRRLEILYAFTAGASLMGVAVMLILVTSGSLSCQ